MAGKFLVLHFRDRVCCLICLVLVPRLYFPGFIVFSWITWIKPNNVIINQVFGSSSGLGMIPNNIALDWNQIAGYIGSPLIPPASVIATIFGSIVVIFWIVVPAIHYSNTWYSQYLPISSTGSFDRFQQTYNVSKLSTIKLYHSMKRNTKSTPLCFIHHLCHFLWAIICLHFSHYNTHHLLPWT